MFRKPECALYPELDEYSDDERYQDFFGGGGLYLATHMLRTLHLKPDGQICIGSAMLCIIETC